MQRLRLEVVLDHWFPYYKWKEALNLTIVRSLQGVQTLELRFEAADDPACASILRSVRAFDLLDPLDDPIRQTINSFKSLRILPLKDVTVTFNCNGYARFPGPLGLQERWIEKFRARLLDLRGAEKHDLQRECKRELRKLDKLTKDHERAHVRCPYESIKACDNVRQRLEAERFRWEEMVEKDYLSIPPCVLMHVDEQAKWHVHSSYTGPTTLDEINSMKATLNAKLRDCV